VYYELRGYPHLLPELPTRGVRYALLANRFWYYDNAFVRAFSGVWNEVPFGELRQDALDRARVNVERHFFFVGEQERFDADLRACWAGSCPL
jgi:hypothetical protein